jgi:hypothetical protein
MNKLIGKGEIIKRRFVSTSLLSMKTIIFIVAGVSAMFDDIFDAENE